MVHIKIAVLRVLVTLNRLNTYRKLKRTFHSFTLNSMGKLYDLPREKGEKDKHYERRLLRKASKTPPGCVPIQKTKKEAAR